MLTPNTLLRGKPTQILEEDFQAIGEEKVNKAKEILTEKKEQLQKRFLKEYVYALGE